MINFDVSDFREMTKMLAPTADFDSSFTFYYDETNNIRKFYVRETDFNSSFSSNFVLGGKLLMATKKSKTILSLIHSTIYLFRLQTFLLV